MIKLFLKLSQSLFQYFMSGLKRRFYLIPVMMVMIILVEGVLPTFTDVIALGMLMAYCYLLVQGCQYFIKEIDRELVR